MPGILSSKMDSIQKSYLLAKVEIALDGLRPHLRGDGGDIEVVDLTEDYTLQIKWLGTCVNCSMSEMTMRSGVQETIRNHVSEIREVVAINES